MKLLSLQLSALTQRLSNCLACAFCLLAVGLLMPQACSGQDCVAPPDGLVGWWPGEGNGLDLAGTNHGTLMGGLTFAPGMVGQAFVGNGTDAFVDLGNKPAFNLSQFTVEAWVFVDPTNPVSVIVMGKAGGSSCNGGFGLYLAGSFGFFLGVVAGCNDTSTAIGPPVYTAGFYHVAGTFDGHVPRVYVNGALAGTGSWISGIGFNSFPLRIGAQSSWETDGINDRFLGRIDEASLYNRALTASEIAALYAAGSAGKCRGLGQLDSPRQVGELVAGDSLWFSGHGSLLSDNKPAPLLWNFGNGRSSPLQVPGLVSFPVPGTNTVTLTVLDRAGASAGVVATRSIVVIPDTNAIPDLVVTQLNVPGNLAIGQPIAINYAVRNGGGGPVSGRTWHDTLFLSRDEHLDVNDRLLGSTVVTNTVVVGGSYSNTLTFTLPAIAEGSYYLLLSANDEWEFLERHRLNNEFTVPTGVAIPRLTNGVPLSGTFAANGDEQYFRIDVSPGQNLLILLNSMDGLGASEVYVRFGALPTRGIFDSSGTAPGRANQQVLVPVAMPGTYYILVRGESGPGNGQFTLRTTASRINVTSVTPDRYGQSAAATLTITGAGFDDSAVAELVATNGTAYGATSVSADAFTQLTATFNLSGVPVGRYAVRVSSPWWGTNTLADVFQVLPAGEARLETSLIVPSELGYHIVGTIYVEYRNTGNAAMPAPLLVLTGTQRGKEGAMLTLHSIQLVSSFWTSAQPQDPTRSVQLLASGNTPGLLQPGESLRAAVYYYGWEQPWDFSYPPMNWNLGVLRADDTNTVDWAAFKTSMKPAAMEAGAWEVLWAGFTNQAGTTWGDYVRMLDDNAAYLGRLGQRVVDVGQLLAFEFLQADGLSPLRTLASAVDASVEAPGLPLVFRRSFAEPISQRFVLGPLGRGWSHNWQSSLQQATDGTVTVFGPGGSQRVFQPDSRGSSYFTQPGDQGTLTALGGGVFTLREKTGVLYSYQADGKLGSVQDLNGNRITLGYSGGLLTALTHSSGQSLQLSYNGAGRIQAITDHLGRQTLLSYDGANEHLTGAQYFDGRTAGYGYNLTPGASQHALTEVASSCCNRRYFDYDAQGRLAGTHLEGNAEAVTFAYDSAGRVTVTDALGHANQFYFDHRGLLAKTEDALGHAVHLAFDETYNLVSITDPTGRAYNYAYDYRGNLVRSVDPLGHATQFSFTSPFNRLGTVTDAKGNTTRYGYNARGNLQSIAYPDSSMEGWTYDPLGNAASWSNRRGHATAYTYNQNGQPTAKHFADGSQTDYAYDGRGNLTNSVTRDALLAPVEEVSMTYDASNRLARVDYPGGKILAFTYDAAGRRASSVDQLGHRLGYAYDAAGRLQSLTNELNALVVFYQYDPAGRIARKTLGSGVTTDYAYDPAGQLLSLTNFQAGGTVLSHFNYTYDSRGRRTAMDTLDGRWSYDYDDIGQLTRAVFASIAGDIPNQDLAYVYDALGNRVRTIENGVTTEYTANILNQYVQVGATNYVFDADGNLTQEVSPGGTTTYTYNDENRMVAMTSPLGTWQYAYDGLGNRVARTENGALTRYTVDPIGLGNVVGEYDAAGNLLAHYDHALGLLSRTDAGGNAAGYTFDAIGNVQELVTAAGAVVNRYAYTPFGTSLRRTEGLPNPFQYVGQLGVMRDTSGLDYMRARSYASSSGRFSSPDPIGLSGGDENSFRYAVNNPVDIVDPEGLRWELMSSRRFMTPRNIGRLPFKLWKFASRNPFWVAANTGYNGGVIAANVLADLWLPGERTGWVDPWGNKVDPLPNLPTGLLGVAERWWDDVRPPHRPSVAPIPLIQTYSTGNSAIAASRDPNQMTGPAGYGPNGFISPYAAFPYRIDFENMTNASAPAQQVVITDPLSADLDWSTFRLTEVGFGDQLILVPPNSQHFETNVSVSYLGTNFQVQIEVGIQLYSGVVSANFRSIDPATSLPPPVNIGFLPPEDGTGRGQGHVSYTINARPNAPTGTQIRNVARISFDLQASIATNQRDPHNPGAGTDPTKECLITIDAGAPTSHPQPLPAQSGRTIPVVWTGQDDPGGSGLANYDVYVTSNGTNWTRWLQGTTGTSASFRGEPGRTYSFCTLATDNVGNRQTNALSAQAVTTVATNVPLLATVSDAAINVGSFFALTNFVTGGASGSYRFWLGGGAPSGAEVNPTNGLFRWTPNCAQASRSYPITIWVADAANTNLMDATSFAVAVSECVVPSLGRLVLVAGGSGRVPVNLIASVPLTNLAMTVESAAGRLTNLWIEPIATQICASAITPVISNTVPGSDLFDLSLTTCTNQFLIGTQQVAWLNFTAVSNKPSAFVNLSLNNIAGLQSDGTAVRNFAPQSGRLVIIGEEPLLECLLGTIGRPSLVLYGKPGWSCEVQSRLSVEVATPWQFYRQTTLVDLFQSIDLAPATNRTQFFRALRQ